MRFLRLIRLGIEQAVSGQGLLSAARPQWTQQTRSVGQSERQAEGVRNKICEAFLRDFLEAWEEFGRPALLAVACTEPVEFVKIAVSLLPKDVDQIISSIPLDRMTNDQRRAIIARHAEVLLKRQMTKDRFTDLCAGCAVSSQLGMAGSLSQCLHPPAHNRSLMVAELSAFGPCPLSD